MTQRVCSFKKINIIDKSLASAKKKKAENLQITNIRTEMGDITTNSKKLEE